MIFITAAGLTVFLKQEPEPDKKTAPENTVNIYNIKEHKLDVGFNRIFPLTKLLVYNMDQIFALPDLIDYDHVSNIQFDGETFWISAK